ncbi:MAG: hypothetical protein JSW68_13625 [Burkholderiales bacterium]|nr:MAG: hypothetical protein JSW68_13625 [Burkholderiales bacterium]
MTVSHSFRGQRAARSGRAALVALLCIPWLSDAPAAEAVAAERNEPPAIATIVEGDAVVLRDEARGALSSGVPLQAEDIVHTGPDGLVRLELSDGTAIDLGPGTRAQFLPPAARRGEPLRVLYLLEGMAKVSANAVERASGDDTPAPAGLRAELFDAPALDGVFVVRVAPTRIEAFTESGALRLALREAKPIPIAVEVAEGRYYLMDGELPGQVQPVPPRPFVDALPQAFMVTLPKRRDRFASSPVELELATPVTYEDVSAWLQAEPAMRWLYLRRWRGRLSDPEFRKAIAENLSRHPEWRRTIRSGRYRK